MYNTGNEVPSSALEDMADNAQVFDGLVTQTSGTVTDRLGNTRRSFQQIVTDMGFNPVSGSFQAGATITEYNQCLIDEATGTFYSWNGALPKVVAAGSSPATSGGIGAGAWVDRTDVTLRGEITAQSGFAVVGKFPSVSSLRNYSGIVDGESIIVDSHTVGKTIGGGVFYWDSTSSDVDDNGVIIKPTAATTGRWVRRVGSFATPTMFGALGGAENTVADTAAHQSALTYAAGNNKVLRLDVGSYYLTISPTYSGSNPVVIAGPGRNLCSLYFNGNINGFDITTTNIVDIRNFSAMAPDVKATGVAVSVTGSGQVLLDNIYIAKTGGSNTWRGGVQFTDCNYTTTKNCFITSTADSGVFGVAWEGSTSSVSHDVDNTMMYSVDIAYYAHTQTAATSGVEGIRITGGEAVCNTGFMWLSDANTAVYVPPLYMISNSHINVSTRLGRIRNVTQVSINNCFVYNSNTTGENWIDNQGSGTVEISGGECVSIAPSSNSCSFHYAGVGVCESVSISNVLIQLPTTGSKLSTATTEGFLNDFSVIGVRLNVGGSWYATGDIYFVGDIPTNLCFANNTPVCAADVYVEATVTSNVLGLLGTRASTVYLNSVQTVNSIATSSKNPLQNVTVVCDSVGTVFTHNAALLLKGSVNATTAVAGDSISFKYIGAGVYREVSRTF